jgi:hypothetical protein
MNEISVQTNGLLDRPVLRPLRQPANESEAAQMRVWLRDLEINAAKDHHIVINPTHVMLKGETVCGYLSIAAAPTVHCWFDSAHPHAADSLKLIEHGETAGRERGLREYYICCTEESPFHKHMARLGYAKVGTTTIYRKEL